MDTPAIGLKSQTPWEAQPTPSKGRDARTVKRLKEHVRSPERTGTAEVGIPVACAWSGGPR
jgi:hypothetical protein